MNDDDEKITNNDDDEKITNNDDDSSARVQIYP
jgi:hypothetical protein